MRFWDKKNFTLFLLASIVVLGCKEEKQVVPEKSAEEVRAEQLATEERQKEFRQKNEQLEAALKKATAAELRSVLQSCKSAILELAKSQNHSPFSVFLVDEYSADVYQAASYVSGGGGLSDADRVKEFIRIRKKGETDLRYSLMTSYSVIFTHDSFSGPVKEPKKYSCSLKPDLTVIASSY